VSERAGRGTRGTGPGTHRSPAVSNHWLPSRGQATP
jgi:hypothetical protein